MAWFLQGRARVSQRSPRARGLCDRCAFVITHEDLQWQMQWQGMQLQNLQILVCRQCLDVPQEQLRTIIIPPDPLPILNPRPEPAEFEMPNFLVAEGADPDTFTSEDGITFIAEGDNGS